MEQVIAKYFSKNIAVLTIGALLLTLFVSPLHWLIQSLHVAEYRIHSLLLIGFVIFFFIKNRQQNLSFQKFEVALAPLLFFATGLIGFTVTEKFLDIDVISCLFLGLTIYGFSGFIIERVKWQNSSVFVLLFFVCLPLSYHIETFLGFPLRILSAKVAASFFSLAGSQVHSTETILLVENKLAHIDLPCSGIKSLWSVSLFSLILSVIEKYKINLSWACSIVSGWLLVASANIFRIIMLVLIYNSEVPETVKESLHAPIGLIGFIVACTATYWTFRLVCQKDLPRVDVVKKSFDRKSFAFVALSLGAAVSINQINFAAAKIVPQHSVTQSSIDSIALTDKEKDLFIRHGVIRYEKRKFNVMGLQGTAFLVLSNSWRGHHHPEQCLQGQGSAIETTKTLVIQNDLQVRNIKIKNSDNEVVYWFQSLADSTDDYSSRVWSGLVHPTKPYTMVSLYIENGKTADPSAYKGLINDFHHRARAMLENGGKNEEQN